MADIARYAVLGLSVLMLVGGVMGFVKAKSKPSLIAGVVSSVLLAATYAYGMSSPQQGLIASFVVTLFLDVVFAMRLAKTKKFMPSGMLLIFVGITQAILAVAIFGAGSAAPGSPAS